MSYGIWICTTDRAFAEKYIVYNPTGHGDVFIMWCCDFEKWLYFQL